MSSEQEPSYRVLDVMADAESALDAAADAVAAGEIIVLPTDTVYGVGADPLAPGAVQRLLEAKQRGRDMPPPLLVAEVDMIRSLAAVDLRVEILAREFWPGALTLVLTAHESLRMDLGERGRTIAVRIPDHAFTRELLRCTGPLAVSSANVSGRPAALTIEEAADQLGESVSVYLDAGAMSGPVPSTIVDLTRPVAHLLRAGRISVAELNAAVPGLLEEPAEPDAESADQATSDDQAAESADQAAPDDQAAAEDHIAGPDGQAPEAAPSEPTPEQLPAPDASDETRPESTDADH